MTYNLVYLIGNGFDIKMGLHTRYEEFYQWYKSRPKSDHPVVQAFRDEIKLPCKDTLWSDLESALGKHLAKITNPDDAREIFRDVQSNIQEYMKIQDDNFSCNDYSNVHSYISGFFYPHHDFRTSSRRQISEFFSPENNNENIYFAIFNYTTTLEKLIGWKGQQTRFSLKDGMTKIICGVEHVHGYCDIRGRLAIGVDNINQIENPGILQDEGIIERFVKPVYNDTYEIEHHLKCLRWIKDANAIVVYGMSLGETDKTWWKAIADRMINSNSCVLIVHFKRDCSFEGNGGPDYREQVRKDRQKIVEALGLKDTLSYDPSDSKSRKALKSITDRIFPTFSSEFLSLPKSPSR